jgi:hypothetical protein
MDSMEPTAQMIVHNIAGLQTPEDTRLLVRYVKHVIQQCDFSIFRAKKWHDCIFHPRYYYTTCSRTLDLIRSIDTTEMTRHVIFLERGSLPVTTAYLMEVHAIVQRIVDAGLWIVWTNKKSEVTSDPSIVFKGGSIEVILEGRPFEQEYVTELHAFQRWLDIRLPKIQPCK